MTWGDDPRIRRLPVVDSSDLPPLNSQLFQHPPLRYDESEFLNLGLVGQLPPTGSPIPPGPGSPQTPPEAAWELASAPQNTTTTLLGDPPGSGRISDHKDGFFQKLSFSGTWLDRGQPLDYGQSELELYATFAVPMPGREWPLLITPLFEVQYLDGPVSPDLPPRLYETYLDFLWVPRLNENWTVILGLAPSVYSDFQTDEDAFRWTGKGLVRYDWSPTLQVLAGVLYLNRDDVRILAAGGLIWNPHDDARYEILFPRPKLARRIAVHELCEDWVYVAGEFGGNTWAIERDSGQPDRLTLRDLRLLLGLERKRDGGAGWRTEIGYVFGRRAEFASGTPTIEPDDTLLLRGGVTY
jgi:hypothetical protein